MGTADPLLRPRKDIRKELKEIGVSQSDYLKVVKARWGSKWKLYYRRFFKAA